METGRHEKERDWIKGRKLCAPKKGKQVMGVKNVWVDKAMGIINYMTRH